LELLRRLLTERFEELRRLLNDRPELRRPDELVRRRDA
jgi:hypothetical protein